MWSNAGWRRTASPRRSSRSAIAPTRSWAQPGRQRQAGARPDRPHSAALPGDDRRGGADDSTRRHARTAPAAQSDTSLSVLRPPDRRPRLRDLHAHHPLIQRATRGSFDEGARLSRPRPEGVGTCRCDSRGRRIGECVGPRRDRRGTAARTRRRRTLVPCTRAWPHGTPSPPPVPAPGGTKQNPAHNTRPPPKAYREPQERLGARRARR